MKQVLTLMALLLCTYWGIAQQKAQPVKVDYTKKGAALPHFYINKTDGGYIIPQLLKKGKPVMILIFSPECDHCGVVLDSIKTIREKFKTTQVILVAEERHKDKMVGFIEKEEIKNDPLFKNIGTNKGELIAAIYTNKILPQIVFYDANHKLVKILDGHYTLADIIPYVK